MAHNVHNASCTDNVYNAIYNAHSDDSVAQCNIGSRTMSNAQVSMDKRGKSVYALPCPKNARNVCLRKTHVPMIW
eukprot:3229343-Amphidinium_carterae.1